MNIFELLSERYTLPEKPRLFETFSGIGCQRMAFNRLGIEVEMVGISEIDKYAIKSYMAIHGETKNWGNICDIHGEDLPEIDVFTYSFPCTDLSKAGRQKGLTNTRSGLVYEVLRILHELDHEKRLPNVLIMENVVDLVQTKFIKQFQEIQLELENLGYSNYTETLNAKDYGVAQNRDRVFMVSILGEYYYEFPRPVLLNKRLKDYLEKNVDDKYYLSEKMLSYFTNNSKVNENKGNGFRFKPQNGNLPASAITTKEGSRMDDNFVESESGTRRLTPRECWRVMGVEENDFNKASLVCSDTQLYKQAGNGIVVDVFAAIIGTMQGEKNGTTTGRHDRSAEEGIPDPAAVSQVRRSR